MQRDAVEPGDRVLLVDDVLATGGTVAATVRLVEQAAAVRRRGRLGADGAGFLPGRADYRRPSAASASLTRLTDPGRP